jgi:hypothetical protein
VGRFSGKWRYAQTTLLTDNRDDDNNQGLFGLSSTRGYVSPNRHAFDSESILDGLSRKKYVSPIVRGHAFNCKQSRSLSAIWVRKV